MYGLSSRDSLSKIQTRWVTAVEETTKVIHVPVSKVSSEVMHLQDKILELEKICHSLEERIVALESRHTEKALEVKDTASPGPQQCEDCHGACPINIEQEVEPSLEEEEELSIDS
jgi:hypothetical protein